MVLTNKPVTRLVIENNKCVGVECQDGSSYRAEKSVVSTIHVKHLVDMAPRELWGEDFLEGVEMFQPEHAMISLHTRPPSLRNILSRQAARFPRRGGHRAQAGTS